MIDAILYIGLGIVLDRLFNHFKGESPAKALSDFNLFKQELKMLSDNFTAAMTRLEQVVDAKIAASDTGAQVDAEATAAVSALADKIDPANQPAG